MVKVKHITKWSFHELGACLYWLNRCSEEGMDLEDVIETTENMYLNSFPLSKKGVKNETQTLRGL